jgi:hypothetical protein
MTKTFPPKKTISVNSSNYAKFMEFLAKLLISQNWKKKKKEKNPHSKL